MDSPLLSWGKMVVGSLLSLGHFTLELSRRHRTFKGNRGGEPSPTKRKKNNPPPPPPPFPSVAAIFLLFFSDKKRGVERKK